jgi:hypothetical protein
MKLLVILLKYNLLRGIHRWSRPRKRLNGAAWLVREQEGLSSAQETVQELPI